MPYQPPPTSTVTTAQMPPNTVTVTSIGTSTTTTGVSTVAAADSSSALAFGSVTLPRFAAAVSSTSVSSLTSAHTNTSAHTISLAPSNHSHRIVPYQRLAKTATVTATGISMTSAAPAVSFAPVFGSTIFPSFGKILFFYYSFFETLNLWNKN